MTTTVRYGRWAGVAAAGLLVVGLAQAGPTTEQQCQAAKNRAVGDYATCRHDAEARRALLGDDVGRYLENLETCEALFSRAWQKASDLAGEGCETLEQSDVQTQIDECTENIAGALRGEGLMDCTGDLATCTTDLATCQACGNGTLEPGEACDVGTLNGATCTTLAFEGGTLHCALDCTFDTSGCWTRFIDNGNGTVTDTQTMLMWEKKTTAVGSGQNPSDPHDVDNRYSWSTAPPWNPHGTAFTDFLVKLNTEPCFAGHCDWRLPDESSCNSCYVGDPDYTCASCGVHELETILLEPYACGTSPCINSIFGPTASGYYWSSTSDASPPPGFAWLVDFFNGLVGDNFKDDNYYVRAVRGGS